MGVAMTMRVRDKKGSDRYVRLTGAEKSTVYRMLSSYGVYERPQVGGQDVRGYESDLPIHEREGEEGLDDGPPEGEEAHNSSVNATTMHCCEAADIIFDDIE
tara:strand:+ start:305 stop:610 length:306 start_codon:yes stop_codon:yes gene_type:complete